MVDVEADRAFVAVGEQLEHAPRAGSEIDEQLEGPHAQCSAQGGLDLALRHVERANAVPFGGVIAEIVLGCRFAFPLHGFGAAAVAHERGIGGIDRLDQAAHESAGWTPVHDLEVGPASVRDALDDTGLGHQLQMAADTGLALAENAGQVLHVEFTRRKQQQQPEPGGLRDCLQHRHDCPLVEHVASSS